ncbi:MAG: hypothetical protein KTR25_15235 [Myxococcales bacterium]|nr:hypothetical protein [Myxococcales bacterium]
MFGSGRTLGVASWLSLGETDCKLSDIRVVQKPVKCLAWTPTTRPSSPEDKHLFGIGSISVNVYLWLAEWKVHGYGGEDLVGTSKGRGLGTSEVLLELSDRAW